jgi:predicted RNA binding protein YcfA (HicA-like mRNA interferase family)
MAQWKKRLAAMQENQVGWRYKQVARMLKRHGYEPPKNPSGSHRVFRHPSGRRVGLKDPGKGTLLPVYVTNALDGIDAVAGKQGGNHDD